MNKIRFLSVPLLLCLNVIPSLALDSKNDLWFNFNTVLDKTTINLKYTGPDGEFSHTAVDYGKIKNDAAGGKAITKQLAKLHNTRPPSGRNEKLAFWINAYNFFTLSTLKSHDKVDSMKKIGWKDKHHYVGGKAYSLEEIEHDILLQ